MAGVTRRPLRLRLPVAVLLTTTLAALAACGTQPAPGTRLTWSMPSVPVATSPAPSPSASSAASPGPSRSVAVPPGVTAAFAVYDRTTGTFTEQRNTSLRFRSASLVKLLIVLDYLWNRGPGYAIPGADRSRLDLMLRSSDDGAASYFWGLDGGGSIVTRMVARLGLRDTQPPPAAHHGWGSTAVSAADLVRVYRYLLDSAAAPVRGYVMGNLRQSTRCGTDGFDQSFGIPGAFSRPWAVKQGWYEFAGAPTDCTPRPAASASASASGTGTAPAAFAEVPAGDMPDWYGEVLHTTGTVGAGDRAIVVVLTLYRHGTAFGRATATLTALTRSLRVPGQP